METKTVYSNFTETKNGELIPVFSSGRTIESKYNPLKDAQTIVNSLEKKYNAFLVLGIGSGILLNLLRQNFPDSLIIAYETNISDIDFLFSEYSIKERISSSNIKLATLSNLSNILIQNYFPAKFGDLKIIEQKNWNNENINTISDLKNILNDAIQIISADFSVQSHFGKVWMKNIINNISFFDTKYLSSIPDYNINQTAYIIAAGPSIDSYIDIIKNDSDAFIIATDTALQILSKYKITPHIVISIDGQHVSSNHFSNIQNLKDTLFLFDLAGDFSATKFVANSNLKINFFISGHPLSALINNYVNDNIPTLFSGTGTVTITALDLAIKMGFINIKILGADFSYSKGKAYAKGSYLDKLYNLNTSKVLNSEKLFDKLLFRTELIKVSNLQYTTQILDSYKKSLHEYLSNLNLEYNYENSVYSINNNFNKKLILYTKTIQFKDFINYYLSQSKDIKEYTLLPFIAYFRKLYNYNSELSFEELLKLAQSYILRYN